MALAMLRIVPPTTTALTMLVELASACVASTAITPHEEPVAKASAVACLSLGRSCVALIVKLLALIVVPPIVALTVEDTVATAFDVPTASVPALTPAAEADVSGRAVALMV